MHGHAVMGEQGVQERAQNAPLWGPSVEDLRGGDVVAYPHHLGAARQEVQYPVAQGGVETQGLELDDEFKGTMVLNAETLILSGYGWGYGWGKA